MRRGYDVAVGKIDNIDGINIVRLIDFLTE
jgi:hypothetical protein